MNKMKIVLVVVLIIAASGYYAFTKRDKSTAVAPAITNENAKSEVVAEPPAPADGYGERFYVVKFTDSGFLPKEISIKAGDVVVFENESAKSMWPASAMHPTHAVYPTTGGCLGSTFDACKGVLPSDSWSFKFDIVGNWKYHDHLTPKFFGAIDVK